MGTKYIFGIGIILLNMNFFERGITLCFTLLYAEMPISFVRDCLRKQKKADFLENGTKHENLKLKF